MTGTFFSAQPAKRHHASVSPLSHRSSSSVGVGVAVDPYANTNSNLLHARLARRSAIAVTRSSRPGFTLQLNFGAGLQALSTKARNAISAAARYWERAITGSDSGSKKIVINIKGGRLQGDTLAIAQPTQFDQTAFPKKGVSTINIRLSREYNNNTQYLKETMTHEFAHVLGIGTLWQNFVDPATATYRADTFAGAAYGQLLGSPVPVAVPLEPTPGDPNNFAHWSESALGNELMTPEDNGKRTLDPVSIITLGALQDLGWKVNYNAAQPYTLP
jgi:hypothetical protein